MKNFKLILTALLTLAATITYAQIDQGDIWLEGGISANSGQSESPSTERKNSYLSILPGIGFLVNDNVEVGLLGGFNTSKGDNVTSSVFSNQNGWRAGVYGTYHIELSPKVYFSPRLFTAYDENNYKRDDGITIEREKYTTSQVGLAPRFSFLATDRIRFGLQLGTLSYSNSKDTYDIGLISEYETTRSNVALNVLSGEGRNSSSSIFVNFKLKD